jgi:tryptophan 2,3-dioxygenase
VSDGTDYSTYLKINDLLTLQQTLTPGAADELLFIVVHQSYELWFKLIIEEVVRAIDALLLKHPWQALAPLRRTVAIEDLLLKHLDVLETMSPEGFLEFRDPLHPASGFQSVQFRAIEFLSGEGKEAMLRFELFDDEQKAWLTEMSLRPTLWDGFCASLNVDNADNEVILEALRQLYHHHNDAERSSLHAVAEVLVDHDERIALWRHRHMLMAGREIGRRPGTGGSEGMAYLSTTIGQRFYPLLWEVRSSL